MLNSVGCKEYKSKDDVLFETSNLFKQEKKKKSQEKRMLTLLKTKLNLLCLWPTTLSPMKLFIRYSTGVTFEAVSFIGVFLYALRIKEDFAALIETCFVCVGLATTMFIYTWLVVRRHQIEQSIDQLESYVNESKFFPQLNDSFFG